MAEKFFPKISLESVLKGIAELDALRELRLGSIRGFTVTQRWGISASFIALLLVASCAGSPVERNMNAKTVSDFEGMSDEKLCNSYLNGNPLARQARANRKLGDCSETYVKCRSYGFEPDDPEFKQCRMLVDQAAASSRRSAPTYVAPQTPTYQAPRNTTCRESLGTVYCQSF